MPAAADVGFAHHFLAIYQGGLQGHIGRRGRVDAPGDFEHLRGGPHGLGEIAHHVGEGRQEEISEAVAFQAAAGLEAVLKYAREQR